MKYIILENEPPNASPSVTEVIDFSSERFNSLQFNSLPEMVTGSIKVISLPDNVMRDTYLPDKKLNMDSHKMIDITDLSNNNSMAFPEN